MPQVDEAAIERLVADATSQLVQQLANGLRAIVLAAALQDYDTHALASGLATAAREQNSECKDVRLGATSGVQPLDYPRPLSGRQSPRQGSRPDAQQRGIEVEVEVVRGNCCSPDSQAAKIDSVQDVQQTLFEAPVVQTNGASIAREANTEYVALRPDASAISLEQADNASGLDKAGTIPLPANMPSRSTGAHVEVPWQNTITLLDGCSYSVLPLQAPHSKTKGHDLWNHEVELPHGWQVLSKESEFFTTAMSTLCSYGWGSLVLGARNAQRGFDAYWTPLFGDGSRAGQMCEADVDWIEPVEGSENRFRMTYSGLRLVIHTAKARQQISSLPEPRSDASSPFACRPSATTLRSMQKQ